MISRIIRFLCVLVAGLGGYLAPMPDKATIVNVLTALVAASGVVVTVFGIWAAIIFPRLLIGLRSGSAPNNLSEQSRYDSLVGALYCSALDLGANALVLILAGIYWRKEQCFSVLVVTFVWLSFFSIAQALASALINGELAANDGINGGRVVGLIQRLRTRGRVQE